MEAKLVVVKGDTKSPEFKLRLPATLGRGREASLTVPHPLISRQHCEIFEKDGFLVVRDLGSLNGTFIDDERISEAVLRDGNLLTIGTVTFRAVYCDDPNLTAPVREDEGEVAASSDRQALATEHANNGPQLARGQRGAASPASTNDDDEFTEFLQSMAVEDGAGDEGVGGGAERTVQTGAEKTVESEAPALSENDMEIVDIDDIEEPQSVEEVAGPEEVLDVDEIEEVEEVEQADAVPPERPAAAERPAPAADAPSPANRDAEAADSGKDDPDEGEDDLQDFLRNLGN